MCCLTSLPPGQDPLGHKKNFIASDWKKFKMANGKQISDWTIILLLAAACPCTSLGPRALSPALKPPASV